MVQLVYWCRRMTENLSLVVAGMPGADVAKGVGLDLNKKKRRGEGKGEQERRGGAIIAQKLLHPQG